MLLTIKPLALWRDLINEVNTSKFPINRPKLEGLHEVSLTLVDAAGEDRAKPREETLILKRNPSRLLGKLQRPL